ncbi:MAG TPA: NAD(P)H-hydrate epimerase [Phycisphaerales bacterium]|nr:NAD(P)H-hydrate epimerase [Phycisphaerales bacterium]
MTTDAPLIFARHSIREVDRIAIEEYGIPGIVLMENAARGAASIALDMLTETGGPKARKILIICGAGNNGGDGYAMARHLHNAGAAIILMPLGEPRPGTDAAINREICRKMGLHEVAAIDRPLLPRVDLLVDAIFGTGLDRAITGLAADIIGWINEYGAPVLAVDAPSGLDADTGKPLGAAVRANQTATFAGLKRGFMSSDAAAFLGEVHVVDIGVPKELLERLVRV